jgi:hypothetical protein
VDAVREVHIGTAGRSEERRGAGREADVGVTGGVVALIALGLDDDPAGPTNAKLAADQLPRHRVHGAIEEGLAE